MKVIDFIKEDMIRRNHRTTPQVFIYVFGIFLFPLVLGILLRDDTVGVFDLVPFGTHFLSALLLFFVALASLRDDFKSKKIFILSIAGLILAVLLATDRVIFPGATRTFYLSSASFWHENAKCFVKGGMTTFLTGLWLTLFTFTMSSWPNRLTRMLISLVAGVSGVVMLGFHCDSSSVSHVFISHLGQGFVMGLAEFAILEIVFFSLLKIRFRELTSRINNFHRLG